MTTSMKIVLDDAQLMELGQRLTGKKQRATRKQVQEWAEKLMADDLAGKDSPTELRPFVCPKCNKPISLRVPKVPKAEAAQAEPARAATKGDVAEKAIEAAKALEAAAGKLRALAS